MASSAIKRKFKKLLSDPNMFFSDMFRKRVEARYVDSTVNLSDDAKKTVKPEGVIEGGGVLKYLVRELGLVSCRQDGACESLLVLSGYLQILVERVFEIKSALGVNLDVYTLGGGVKMRNRSQTAGAVQLLKVIRNRSDFVLEFYSESFQEVVHCHTYDVSDSVASLRSNSIWLKKIPLESLSVAAMEESSVLHPPIDVVYTWVDQADTDWQKLWAQVFPEKKIDPDRYTNNDELKYSLRSVHKYASWVRKIFIVSNCKKPDWLRDHEKVEWVSHEAIFPDVEMLPTFSSHSIECCLHRIPGLSENFIYFNDDFILNHPCSPLDFFDITGRSISYFEPYGMVSEFENGITQHDYLVAARNGRRLLNKACTGYSARKLHRHIPYALRKTVLMELEVQFPTEFNNTRRARLRSAEDLSVTSFFYHHYAYARGYAVSGDAPGLIVRPSNIKQLLSVDMYKYKFLCFNDGGGSSVDQVYKKCAEEFYQARFSCGAPWEITSGRGRND